MNAAFFGLAFTAALNPKLLGADLLIIENRRPRAMFICFLAGGLGMSITIGIVDVLFVQADAVKTQPCIVIDRSGQIGFNAEVLTEGSVGDAGYRAASAGRRRCLDGRRQFGRSCRALIALDVDHSAFALAASWI